MPFVQRENISHFLRACEMPPFNMPSHDRFLTVDLYDGKDPAQVLQCIQAFSRAANTVNPSQFPYVIGPRGQRPPSPIKKPADWAGKQGVSHVRGPPAANVADGNVRSPPAARALSPAYSGGSNASGRGTVRSPVSAWTNKREEASTAPAWNIHQYGYMGGANQGSQGINFGVPRQITSAAPSVPSLAEKEKLRKEKAELERLDQEADRLKKEQLEADERKSREEEEQRWAEETRRARDAERAEVEKQKRKWEEEERCWREEEEQRKHEEALAKSASTPLQGQYLSDYQSQSAARSPRSPRDQPPEQRSEQDRIRELEQQLEEARERERQYLESREVTVTRDGMRTPLQPSTPVSRFNDALEDESVVSEASILSEPDGGILSSSRGSKEPQPPTNPRPLPIPQVSNTSLPASSSAPAPSPLSKPQAAPFVPPATNSPVTTSANLKSSPTRSRPSPFGRPMLSTSSNASSSTPSTSTTSSAPRPVSTSPFTASRPVPAPRTDRFLASNPPPASTEATSHVPSEAAASSRAEQDAEDRRRKERQTATKAGGWASKSLLEREMERERERQREWEEAQMARGGRVMGPRAMGQK